MAEKFNEISLNLLRIMSGFLMAPHGAQKLFGVLGGEAAELATLRGLAGIIEFFGGVALMFGLFTQPVAFVMSGQMAAAYWMAHGTQAFWPIINRGELAALYCFVFLFLWSHGGGSFSIDGWLRKRKETAGAGQEAHSARAGS